MKYPIVTRMLIAGVEAYAGPDDLRDGHPTLLDGLQFTWGRSGNIGQPDVETCNFVLRQQLLEGSVETSILDAISQDDPLELWVDITYPDDTVVSSLVWAGGVGSAVAQSVNDHAVTVSVSASGVNASLADETIGDEPWQVEDLETRVERIMQLAETDTAPVSVDASIADVQLSYRDVDAEGVLTLLQEIANSAGAVLWVVEDAVRGIFLWMEDPTNRASTRQFVIDPVTHVLSIDDNVVAETIIDSADLLRDPIRWTRDKSQMTNSVDVSWLLQGVDADGFPVATQLTATATVSPKPRIYRKLSIDTQLTTALDANELANRLLTMTSGDNRWLASGVTIDTRVLERDPDASGQDASGQSYEQRLDSVARLLDGGQRFGIAVTLAELQGWTPGGTQTSVYVEGGTYTLENGRWEMELNVSSAVGQGKSATFGDFAGTGVTLADIDPSITLADCQGVAGPNAFGFGFGGGPFGVQPFGV